MGAHSYARAQVGGGWDVGSKQLSLDVEGALPGKLFKVRCVGTNVHLDFVDTLAAGEITTLDTTVSAHKTAASSRLFVAAQTKHMNQIDAHTGALIASGGFTYQGVLFSESSTMQRNLLALSERELRSLLDPVLPLTISSRDNLSEITITTSSEMLDMVAAAAGAAMGPYIGGNALKSQVRAITHDTGEADVPPNYHTLEDAIAAVQAVQDTR